MNEAAIDVLRSALPATDFAPSDGLEIEGQSIAAVLAPEDPEALSRALTQLSAQGSPLSRLHICLCRRPYAVTPWTLPLRPTT